MGGTAAYESHGSRAAGSNALMVLSDLSGVNRAGIVLTDGTGTGDDGAYGSTYTRTSTTLTLNSGSATIASPSYTRASAPSLTLASSSITSSSGGLVATPLTPAPAPSICTATGRASTLLFGLPIIPGVQLPYTISTLFGTPDGRNRGLYATGKPSGLAFGTGTGFTTYGATGLASTVAFGTPAVNLNFSFTPDGIASTLAFGVPLSLRGVGPAPIGIASSIDSTLTFGTARIASVLNATATGLNSTAIPEPRSGWGLYATGLASTTAFGTSKVNAPCTATGFKSTAIGVPTARVPILAAGFSSTLFGTPSIRNAYAVAATGWSSTVFGTPTTRGANRTRGAKFRTTFGTARAERTAP